MMFSGTLATGYLLIGFIVWAWSIVFMEHHFGLIGAAAIFLIPPLGLLVPILMLLNGVWIPIVLELVGVGLLFVAFLRGDATTA